MTIIQEERFTLGKTTKVSFDALRKELILAIREDQEYEKINEEKKRLVRSAANYKEFRDLVSTVNLVPFSKRRLRASYPAPEVGEGLGDPSGSTARELS